MEVQQVILVNEKDEPIGFMEKMEAHQKGLLHRAFSVFIFNAKGEMLMQQRALHKYHSAGLWTNACCSHPKPGEEIEAAAKRRLMEELGIEAPAKKLFTFNYKAHFSNGLIEHEVDHVLAGEYDGPILFNKEEVNDVCYKEMKEIKEDMINASQLYTAWFHLAFDKVENWWKHKYKQVTF